MGELIRISAFVSWYLQDVLNKLEDGTLLPIHFSSDKKILEHLTDECFLLPRCVLLDWLFQELTALNVYSWFAAFVQDDMQLSLGEKQAILMLREKRKID